MRSSCHHDGVAPFGDRRINACSRLPYAYRSYATSFIGTQRRGIHRVLIVSSFQEHLERTGGRETSADTKQNKDKKTEYDALLLQRYPCEIPTTVGERHAANQATVVMGIGKVQIACLPFLRTQTSFRDLHP